MKRFFLILLLAAMPLWSANAAINAFKLETPEQEARFKKLSEELRCLVCQNQNLADSNAELALDLRRQVYEMIIDGKSDEEIVNYMVARYGDFVLYRPPVKPQTFLLWFGPLLLLAIGSIILIMFVRRRSQEKGDSEALSAEETDRLDALLHDKGDDTGEQK